MWPLLVLLATGAPLARTDFNYHISDEQYYRLPRLFSLDDYEECVSQQGSMYCVGSFRVAPTASDDAMYDVLERYSANWMDHFDHTRAHRGVCVSAKCPLLADRAPADRFESCVNDSLVLSHGLSATLHKLEYCHSGHERPHSDTLDNVYAAVLSLVLALTLLSTAADLLLSDQEKTGSPWMVAFSVRVNWRCLTHDPHAGPLAAVNDMRVCDGLRAFSMICVVMEHVCWITTSSYQMNPRFTELTRRSPEALLLSNSTLLVQVFFILSSFLLAHKLLQSQTDGNLRLFVDTMLNRIVRISPAYWAVVGFAATWWRRLSSGPLWTPLVEAESAICRDKWWAQLLYLNNAVRPDDKCLIQTWYLAADLQLYAVSLTLTLALRSARRPLTVLLALLGLSAGTLIGLSLLWGLRPTFVVHNPEAVRAAYAGDVSFNWLYQSALGNAPGALAGLLLAFLHHDLLRRGVRLERHKWCAWLTRASAPAAAVWVAAGPPLLLWAVGGEGATGVAGAILAGSERTVFSLLVAAALLGALHGVHTPWRDWLSWSGWRLPARLAFPVLLLHMLLNKLLVASRAHLTQLTRMSAIYEWGAVYVLSFILAIPFALLVELPPSRLYRAQRRPRNVRLEKNAG